MPVTRHLLPPSETSTAMNRLHLVQSWAIGIPQNALKKSQDLPRQLIAIHKLMVMPCRRQHLRNSLDMKKLNQCLHSASHLLTLAWYWKVLLSERQLPRQLQPFVLQQLPKCRICLYISWHKHTGNDQPLSSWI